MGKLKKYLFAILLILTFTFTATLLVYIPLSKNNHSGKSKNTGHSTQQNHDAGKTAFKKSEPREFNREQPVKVYSLENDRKYEKALWQQQQDKLKGFTDLKETGRELLSKNPQKRVHAVEILGYFPANEFLPLIENLLENDPSAEVRCQCAKSLRMLESKQSVPQLIRALNDHDHNVRIFTALALAYLGEKERCSEAVNALWNNGNQAAPLYSCHQIFLYLNTPDAVEKLKYDLENSDRFVALDAAIILAQLGHSHESFLVFEDALKDGNRSVRRTALRGLAYIGDQRALALIGSMEKDEDLQVRERAASILNNFENNPFSRLK